MLLSELAIYLEGQGIGNYDPTGVSGDTFIASLPSAPDSIISLFPTGGLRPDVWEGYAYPSVQIRVRGTKDPRPVLERAQSIIEALHGLGPVSLISGTYVVSITADQSSPVYIGRDSSGRHEYTTNFTLHIRQPTEILS